MKYSSYPAKRTGNAMDLAYTALGAVLIAVCSWITIPMAVPFTMQTFAVFLTLSLLGGRRGTAAIAAYVLLGAVGLPVFSGFSGGFGVLLGATGGYIAGFVFTDWFTGLSPLFSEKNGGLKPWPFWPGLSLCTPWELHGIWPYTPGEQEARALGRCSLRAWPLLSCRIW